MANNSNLSINIKWITIKAFAEITGFTLEAIKAKRARGIWRDGDITKKTCNTVFINIERYNEWVETGGYAA